MKKRTLVCFLIFTLCVLYTSIPNTVFGQEDSLAVQVRDKYLDTLQREDIQAVLPQVLEGLKDPSIQPLLNPATIGLVVDNPDLLTQFVPDIDPRFVELLKVDVELQTLLTDPQVQELLQDPAAIDELAGLLAVGTEPPEEPMVEPPEEPMVEPTLVEPPEEPMVKPPEEPMVEPTPAMTLPPADPFAPIMPANESIFGESRLGGLSLNTSLGRNFVEGIIAALGLPIEADAFVDAILEQVPKGFLPKKQIRQILTSAFSHEANQLASENFGNAIMPNFADFAYLEQSSKHLTSNSMHVYTRVPSANVGGVMFSLSDGRTIPGTKVAQEDTVLYTFQLEETLAAANLPAWPSLDTELFSSVVLHYSNTGPNGSYTPVDMHSNGGTWEAEVPVPTGGSTYYYFEVTLTEPVEFMTLSREKLAEIFQDPHTVSLAAILGATTVLEIPSWAMPDPRNLQLVDRGIIDALFDADVRAAFRSIWGSPQAAGIVRKVLNGQAVNLNEVLGAITPKQQRRLRNLLLRNANRLTEKFENSFDPMLASVFTVPRINPETESIWAARIDSIADGNYYLEALVQDADGNPMDQIQETFTVDTSAPEAKIHITPGDANTAGYMNGGGIYVATAHNLGNVILDVTGVPEPAYAGQGVGPGEGYLFYQEIGLDAHGVPHTTWMPLTIESTMLASRIWISVLERNENQIVSLLKQNFPQLVGGLDAASIVALAKTTSPEAILALLTPETIQISANSFFKSLGLKNFNFTDAQAAAIHQALGGSIKILDELVPVTFDAPHTVKMVVPQGIYGDYGVRAMGIDTLFNVGAYAEPTRLRVVMPDRDEARVTAASIGDRNGDGDADEPYESGTIYSNTTDGVMLTVTVDKRTVHPASIRVEYRDANDVWQPIDERMLAEGEEIPTFEVNWDVTDFDALVGAGEVMVRTVTTNYLQLTHESHEFPINLDPDVHPVDLEVLAVVLDTESITKTNPDSGGPQGTVTINAYTPEQTYPKIASLQLVIGDEIVGTAESRDDFTTPEDIAALEQNTDFITDLVAVAGQSTTAGGLTGKPISYPTYRIWKVKVDTEHITETLGDTIEAGSAAERDASKDDNQHMVTAIAITSSAEEVPGQPGAKTYLSVDNDDDVAPLGPTNIVAVADVAGMIEADADGNYTVGGIVDETVQSPIAIYTTEPTADPSTYASVKIVQVDADGNETMIDGEVGVLDITTDVGMLENGALMLHALAVDEFGNVQTDESPQTTVNVLNFRLTDVTRLRVTAVDGVDVPRTPPEPIPLRSSLTVGFDVDNGSLDAEELSGSVPGNDVSSESEENPENSFSLKVDVSGLPDGVYTPEAVVTKRNGSVNFPLKTINLDNTGPIVEIQTPSEDDTVDSLPTVHATYHDGEGSGVNGASGSLALARLHPPDEVSVAVDQNSLEKDEEALVYTRTEKLPGGAYRVTVQVADILGNVGEGSAEFAINGTPADTTPPVITEAAPSGVIKGESWVTLSAVVNDAESKVISVKFGINDKPFRSIAPAQIAEGRVQTAESFTAGTHTVKLIAVSEGGTREHTWTFTLEVDNVAPTITSITPTGTIRAGLPVISASANDESGVDEMDIVLFDSDGEEVKGDTEDDGEDDVAGITRLDFIPEEPLDEGTYTIDVRATDTIGNSATAKGSFTIDFDTAAPVITMSSPQNEARLTERRPQISITFADAESGVDVDSIRFVLDDQLINLTPNQKSASQVVYTSPTELAFGQHTVKLEVSDMAHKEGNVSEKSSGARKANMAVHEFTFSIESEEGPVLASRPINAPNPFKENTRISFTLTRQSTVSIIIYDMTLRPVRVLVDNEVWDAGEYIDKGAIGWDGTSTAGEDLARGIYFCQIMVADGFEPEYAILKLALTR